jgi:uncharacterized membrane protein (DUF2068 family)
MPANFRDGTLGSRRPNWRARLWWELSSRSGEHDLFIKFVIVERLVRGVVLAAAAVSLLVVGRLGYLPALIAWAQGELNLTVGSGLLRRLVSRALDLIGSFPHQTALAIGVLLFAALETAEAVGLARRRRWAEYLTVIATGALIPLELVEVARRPTPIRVGALVLNVAIVVWMAYRKRLFVSVFFES